MILGILLGGILLLGSGGQPSDPGETNQVPSSSFATGIVLHTWERIRTGMSVEIWEATRGSTDSLLLTLQSTNNLADTLSWTTICTKFGAAANGSIVTAGHYQHNFNLYGMGVDTTRFFGRWCRLTANHSVDAVDGSTDTSTYFYTISTWRDTYQR